MEHGSLTIKPIPMTRPVLLTLRILAVASALTVAGCLVMHRQNAANAQSQNGGDNPAQGAPGADGNINYGEPIKTRGVNALGGSETVILGTKSAAVFSPRDVQEAPPPTPQVQPPPPQILRDPSWAASSKSGPPMRASDIRQFRQEVTPAPQQQQQSAPRQQ